MIWRRLATGIVTLAASFALAACGHPFTSSVGGNDGSAGGPDASEAGSPDAPRVVGARCDNGTSTPGFCTAPDKCCLTPTSTTFSTSCKPTCLSNDVGLDCGGTADCPAGHVCCVLQVGPVTASRCEQGACMMGEAQLCDPAGDPGCGDCSTQASTDWGLPMSYGTCGGKGP